jgi:hypothetical protein
MDEFEKTRWKLADEMDAHDIEVLSANKDKLNDEEKAAFGTLLNLTPEAGNTESDVAIPDVDPLEQAIATAGDEPVTHVIEPPVPTVPTPPVLPDNVITQDKLDSYIEGKRKEWEAEGKTAAEQKTEQDKIEKLFDEGYTPKDWNEYSTQFLDKVAPILEKRFFAKLEAAEAQKTAQRQQMSDTQKAVYAAFENEFKTLATNKLIPDPSTQADEYKKVHDAIIAIGDAHGKTNITDAYKLWSIIPVDKGGGLDYQSSGATAKQKIEAQKQAAGRIGKGGGGIATVKPGAKDYNTIHNMNIDDLIEARLSQP